MQVWICQVTCYIAEDQLFQWIEKVGYILNVMNISSLFWWCFSVPWKYCSVYCNVSWQCFEYCLAGWLCYLLWCRSLTVCSTVKWTSLCCQIALWLNTRRQTICAVALPPSYGLFIAALSVGSLYAHHWSSRILSRVFQLPVMIVHARICLMHAPKLPL